jgi:hypothetical protein
MSLTKWIVPVVGITLLGLLAISELGRVDAAELDEEDFVPLATQGFLTAVDGEHPEGSRRNSYIWSMRWWNDKLYVGTIRDVLCFRGGGVPPEYATVCPPPGTLTPDQRAEIWEYTPGGEGGIAGTWQRVFQSPLIPFGSALIPLDIGYRNMLECDAGGTQFLYVVNIGAGGRVLYTQDGITYSQASSNGLDTANDLGYRSMACWKGRLWISPAGIRVVAEDGSVDRDNDIAFNKLLLVNDDPSNSSSPWEQVLDFANDPDLGDPENVGIFTMTVFNDALYLGVSNRATGFEIWKADGAQCKKPPRPCKLSWQKIIDDGLGRPLAADGGPSNAEVFDFGEFNGYLYWGASESRNIRVTTAEMIRIGPDDRVDLIVGEPRDATAMAAYPNFNCNLVDSSCVSLSGMGSGFGPTPETAGSSQYIWQIQAHNGSLYAGTLESGGGGGGGGGGTSNGFHLWGSDDGITWSLVSDDGFGNPFNQGVRKLESSPLGLFVGTANPFTLEEGANGGTGGGEVWLGSSMQHSSGQAAAR